jgi:uncharacterized protein
MQQQVSVVTVGVNNLVRSRHFYVDGFGWTPAFENEQIIFYQMNGFVFGTWLALALADDMRRPLSTPGAFALGHNVPTRKEVQATMDHLARFGGRVLREPDAPSHGGFQATSPIPMTTLGRLRGIRPGRLARTVT